MNQKQQPTPPGTPLPPSWPDVLVSAFYWPCYAATGNYTLVQGTWEVPQLIHVPEPPECPWCQKSAIGAGLFCQCCGKLYHDRCGYKTTYLSVCKECLFEQAYL